MQPVALRTARLVLDLPVEGDVARVAEYCTDPLFEAYLTTPWPYTEAHARGFLTEYVPGSWRSATELTWAIRSASGEPLMGVIGLRLPTREIGYWLGAEHRGSAYMTEALLAVCEWAFAELPGTETVTWRANAGNLASAMVARAAGFRSTTTPETTVPGRDGADLDGWSGERGATPDPGAYESWVPLLGGAV
ncbi:GNAT family N-acetyltransferase [Agromyces sp. NPDC058136]|uniref:GNAT family N-acetyltransferase n=1 Tax=Agromyces sp. NPDC058136 TaxID=3346354 RepID=UPI0036D8A558